MKHRQNKQNLFIFFSTINFNFAFKNTINLMKIEIHKIIRSHRKTIALLIDKNCNLIVKAPISAPIDYIEKVVERKKNWIVEKKKELSQRKKLVRDFSDGSIINIFGENYTIKFVNNFQFALKLQDHTIFIDEQLKDEVKSLLKLLIKKLAQLYFNRNVKLWADKMQLKYNQIKIKDAKSRWGSCSGIGNLNFNWKLGLAPKEVIDYVIVHELSHLRYLNHSPNFWDEVAKYFPEYKKCKRWLREYGYLLDL